MISVLMLVSPVQANVATVKIDAPDRVEPGQNFTISLEISHLNSNSGHYVDWIRLYMDEELLKGWVYDSSDFITGNTFTVSYQTSIERETEFKASPNCNLHGGNEKTKTIKLTTDSDGNQEQETLLPVIIIGIVILVIALMLLIRRR